MKSDCTLDKYKALLATKGFTLLKDIDYFDTFAPIARRTSIRLFIDLEIIHGLVIHQMDVKTAFLNRDIDEEVYIKQPEGFVIPGQECKVYEFGWKERMRVATNYALVLKILTMKKLDLIWSCDDILIDEISNESLILLLSKDVLQYILETPVYPREQELLKEIRIITANHPLSIMASPPDSGQLIALLLKLINPKKTIEIGVFTEYSLLLTALAIPQDGKITAIDMDRDTYEMGLPVIKKAGVEHKINFIQSPALSVLDELLEDHENRRSFDFAFVDADKDNYQKYHERLWQLLKVGGIVVYDNTLWNGTVAMPEGSTKEELKPNRLHIVEFNKFLAVDYHFQISQVRLGDGITICRRL
ncbi:probable caffeoyl-CoA O-methyltransferase At4g26220 [Capsicum annuum]|uniref:probable caffeoyl-CoA O-methyltransferase At4g26220 n=1 Tax=Capsicum annuum TaxID=4072 RepID=UPI001FB113CD|nr:probable caffeoyl-CoA O-methyltransferase At4g26220 [Capsicum annuum]